MPVAFVAAQALDLVTFTMLPAGAEANPLVVALGPLAIPAKVAMVCLVLWAARYQSPTAASRLFTFGALVGAFGAGSNTSVLIA